MEPVMSKTILAAILAAGCCLAGLAGAEPAGGYPLKPTPEDQAWLLPKQPPHPADNAPTPARVELGKMLFFDPRLSSDGNMSCASCHSPLFGWSDGLPTAKGNKSKILGRATPTVVNTGFNTIQMWDGRKKSLEDQAMGPMESNDEMAMDLKRLFAWLASVPGYRAAFDKAYPGMAIDNKTASMAIASFERAVVSNDSRFDRWLRGDAQAMSPQQVRGFRLFADAKKGNCAVCHAAPNFTDNGFHNIGLASVDRPDGDVGRFAIRPLPSMKGAFKTPTLRDVALTAPYFHDGSAATLVDVVEHYNKGGAHANNRSGDVRPLNLNRDEVLAIAAFMEALTSPQKPFALPLLPQ
jgi:cytochrome c peroxidase